MALIDPDIRKAKTLPSRFYTTEESFQSLLPHFEGWQFAAHRSDISENNMLPLHHIEQINGECMVLVNSDQIRCLSNVCTHRGMRVVMEECNSKKLRCGYHGRSFELDGSFSHMPKFEEVIGFPTADVNLTNYCLEEWMGLLFTSVNESQFPDLSILEDRIGWIDIASFNRDTTKDRDYAIAADWALYCENYLEGFHVPYVHPELHSVIEHDDYRVEVFDGGVLQTGIAREGEECFNIPESSPDHGQKIAAYYIWLFPNLMLNLYPWGLSINIVVPVSSGKCRVLYRGYVKDNRSEVTGAGGDLDTVETQDQWVVEAVQRGLGSRSYDRGRYSPSMEIGVHHFHRLLTK